MFTCALLLSSAAATAAVDPFVTWMRALHDDWAVPGYESLHDHSQALVTELTEGCSSGMSESRVRAAQADWLAAMLTWRRLEALQMGPTLTRRSSKTLDFWPTRPSVIEQAVGLTSNVPVSGPEADEAMARWGTPVKGLPALEWLLFGAGNDPAPVTRSPAHCLYTLRVAHSLEGEVGLLLGGWRTEAIRWHEADPQDVRKTRQLVLNLLVGSAELLRGKKLEKAARAQAMSPPGSRGALDAFDSMRTGNTRRFLLAHLDGAAQILLGRTPGLAFTDEAPATGLDDVLAAEGRPRALGITLRNAVVAARREIAALPADPRTWSAATVAPASRALAALRLSIDPPIAKAWDVLIDFTDADGD